MIVVLNPNLYIIGKLYLKYLGNNISLLRKGTALQNTRIFGYRFDNLTESLMFNFKLHNNL